MREHEHAIRPPRLTYALLEPGRTMVELGQLALTHRLLKRVGQGDGHSIMVLPGFLGADGSTAPLRYYFNQWGYEAHSWGQGRNLGPGDDGIVEERLAERLDELYSRSGRPVSLVVWSLGGVFARELARAFPHQVRQVITLGSPIGGDPKATSIWRLYESATQTRIDSQSMLERLASVIQPVPGVPCTAIYSRSDGIVGWQIARERPAPLAENIRVKVSHAGLGFSTTVLLVAADRLAQQAGNWQPFQRPACYLNLFKGPDAAASAA
jgi:pimeloyl-ACP methyl ester carboxylesterase